MQARSNDGSLRPVRACERRMISIAWLLAMTAAACGDRGSPEPTESPAPPSIGPSAESEPAPVLGPRPVRSLAAGMTTTAYAGDGFFATWGADGVRVECLDEDVTDIAVSGSRRCVVRGASLVCNPPVAELGLSSPPVRVATMRRNVCAVLGDGTVTCIATGAAPSAAGEWRQVPLRTHATDVALGIRHVCALGERGEVFCWGSSDVAQTGVFQREGRVSPTRVELPEPARAITAASAYSCAVGRSGRVFCWGEHPALSEEAGLPRQPQSIGLDEPATSVAGGERHACALLRGGRVACWGLDSYGALGRPSTGRRITEPTLIPGLSSIRQISVGLNGHACAESSSAEVYCWGYNTHRQVADISDRDVRRPRLAWSAESSDECEGRALRQD